MGQKQVKILVVDDEPDIREFITSYFGRRGVEVSTTPSGKEFLSMVRVSKPDLVLLDIKLKDISGIEALKLLREFDKETKVVIVTGQMYSEAEVKKIRALGVTEYLNKPLVLEELNGIVQSILGNKPLPPIKRVYKRVEIDGGLRQEAAHQLANLLGIIRNKCENFTSNLEDHVYKDKTDKELVKMSASIMKDIIETVDRATEVIQEKKDA
ncbi:MAG: response regulator [Candidatus Omnitrophica bacterium]|nr:response regulator [Candidatus Omnitrophota bacterium]